RIERALPELGFLRRCGIPGRRQADAERQHMIRIEPRGLALQPDETANRQPRADEQHERQRDFSSDEGRPDPALAAAVAACSLPEIVVDVQMEELVGWCGTGVQAGGRRGY